MAYVRPAPVPLTMPVVEHVVNCLWTYADDGTRSPAAAATALEWLHTVGDATLAGRERPSGVDAAIQAAGDAVVAAQARSATLLATAINVGLVAFGQQLVASPSRADVLQALIELAPARTPRPGDADARYDDRLHVSWIAPP